MGETAVREEKSMLAPAKANLNVCIIREDAGGAASAIHFREELLGGVDDLAPAEHELPAAAAALAPQHGRAARGEQQGAHLVGDVGNREKALRAGHVDARCERAEVIVVTARETREDVFVQKNKKHTQATDQNHSVA